MPIGNQATYSTTSLNNEIAQVAINFHNAADHAQDFFERINALGVAGLIAIGFDTATADKFFTLANQMNTAAMVWFGDAAQTPPFNFDDASAAAR
jgi:hypothetical protein